MGFRERIHPVVICCAGFICFFSIGLIRRLPSVLFLNIVGMFDTTVTKASLGHMLNTLFASFSSLTTGSVLLKRFTSGQVIIGCGIAFCVTTIGLSLAPNIETFILLHGCVGFCEPATSVSIMTFFAGYYDKRRAFATTIAVSGMSSAMVVGAPFVLALHDGFGVRGTYLITAGIILNTVVAGMLVRPKDTKPESITERDDEKADIKLITATHSSEDKEDEKSSHNHKKYNDKTYDIAVEQDATQEPLLLSEQHRATPYADEDDIESDANKENPDKRDSQLHEHDRQKVDTPDIKGPSFKANNKHVPVGTLDVHTGADQDKNTPRKDSIVSLIATRVERALSIPDDDGLAIAASLQKLKKGNQDIIYEDANKGNDEKTDNSSFLGIIKGFFGPHLFKLWVWRWHMAFMLTAGPMFYIIIFLPTIALYQGATLEEAGLLVTISGACDIVFKILQGCIVDSKILRANQMVGIAMLGLGTVGFCNTLFTDFTRQVMMAIVVGAFIGTRPSLIPSVVTDMIGKKEIGHGLGLTLFVGTMSVALHSVGLSAWVDATGSFIEVLYYCGGVLYLSAFGMFMIPVIQRFDRKKGTTLDKDETPNRQDEENTRV